MAKKKVLYHHDNAPSHTSLKAMVKLDQLRFELVAHPPYSPDLAPSNYYLFPNSLKRWLQEKRFTSNEEVIAETEAYFKGLDVSYYRKGIEMLENRYPSVSPSKATMLRNKYNFAQKTLVFIKNPGTFQPM
ncbi:Mariner Mos1 transposase [Acromyrmex echinatior]|uniref:Mariner Mos1 transposase n=1 Tax=Acromyrmex echinatior TaxID=103372 RepID=F4WSW5_ACREC|nr:Mariner Mos1 transposase [Acromyrmex echinatior]